MHRTRAVAAWRRYIWSLDTPLLAQVVSDIEAELRKTEKPPEFTPELLLAHSHVMLGRPDRAEESLLRAEELAPGHVGTVLIRALLEISKRGEESLTILDHYIDRLTSEPKDEAFGAELLFLGHVHRGVWNMRLRAYDAASADLEQAVTISRAAGRDPPGPLIQRLARAHQALGEYARAEELIREMLVRDPADALNYFNLGVLYYEQDRFDESRKWYEAAAARDPTYADPHLRLGYLASVAGDLPRLLRHVEIFERLSTAAADARGAAIPETAQIEIEAAYGSYWCTRANRLRAAGAEDEATEAFARARERLDTALRIQPHCLRALTLRVQIAAQTDEARLEELRGRLDAVQSQDEDTPQAHRSVFC